MPCQTGEAVVRYIQLNKIKILFNLVEEKFNSQLLRGHFGVSKPDGVFRPADRTILVEHSIVLQISIVSRPEFVLLFYHTYCKE